MDFTRRASALLNPFALQSHQTAPTHYSYNPLYEGYHTLVWPGDCTLSLTMEAHELVFLRDLDVGVASFIQLLGFAKVRSNPCPLRCLYSIFQRRNTYFSVAKSIRKGNYD